MTPLVHSSRREFGNLLSKGFALYLFFSSARLGLSEDHVSAKWQDYQEDDERIRVVSSYLGFEKQLNASLALKGHAVYDSISGASPLGVALEEGRSGVGLVQLTDIRRAGVLDLMWTQGIHETSVQYSYSKESDFLSRGYAVSRTSELNKRNTGLSYGVSYVDDRIIQTTVSEKESWDYFVGVSQVIDANTVVALNLTYGEIDGYLNDSYKRISQNIFFGSDIVYQSILENRPESRYRGIAFFNVKRFFDGLGASLDADVRYFEDSWGVQSLTYDLEWYQKIGERFIVRPNFRYYRQSEADFYQADLTGLGFNAQFRPTGEAPYYASDYRLSEMQTIGYGLKVIYKMTESIKFDVTYERYEMKGLDGVTHHSAYPDASILTFGGTLWF
tara:strand:+ start:630 stop:1793 length:1164 start_codon:yes stop_codon:yes gene_type:complete